MGRTTKGRWAEIRDRVVSTPEIAERYERTKRTVVVTRQLLMRIDGERERAGLSKAELARRIGTSPSVIRRLLSSKYGNPTLRTVLDVMDALGMDLQFKSTRQRVRRSSDESAHQLSLSHP